MKPPLGRCEFTLKLFSDAEQIERNEVALNRPWHDGIITGIEKQLPIDFRLFESHQTNQRQIKLRAKRKKKKKNCLLFTIQWKPICDIVKHSHLM